jgi:hypothetical protein
MIRQSMCDWDLSVKSFDGEFLFSHEWGLLFQELGK